MSTSILEDLEVAVLQLSQPDRVHLTERLLASLDEEDEILAAWIAEAERRADAYDHGEMGTVSLEAALSEARARLSGNAAA